MLKSCIMPDNEATNQWIRVAFRQNTIDWDYIIRLSEFHGIFSFVYDRVSKFEWIGAPGGVGVRLRKLWQEHMARNIVLCSEFDFLMGEFSKEAIEVIPLKGVCWAKQFYPDENLRSFNDLDFLVKPEDLDLAKRILKSQNYQPEPYIDPDNCPENSWNIGFYKALPGRKRVCVELHWGLARPRDYRIPLEKWWDNSRMIRAKGQSMRCFTLEDTLLYMTIDIHASKYMYLKQFLDLRQLIVQNKDILDFGYIEKSARSMGLWNNLCFAVYMAGQLFEDEQLLDIINIKLGIISGVFEKSGRIYVMKRLLDKQKIVQGRYSGDVRQFFLLLLLNDKLTYIIKAGVRTLFPSMEATVYRYYIKPGSKMIYLLYLMNPFFSFFRLFVGEKGFKKLEK